MKTHKPILTVRPGEGVTSLIRRVRFKLVLDKREEFDMLVGRMAYPDNRDELIVIIEQFFDVEFK